MKSKYLAKLIFCSGLLTAIASVALSQPYTFTTPVGQSGVGAIVDQTGDGTNNVALFRGPAGVALDTNGNVYVTDVNAVRRISPFGSNWVVTTLAGLGWQHGLTDGTGTNAMFNYPQGIAADAAGNLYIADTANNSIRKLAPVGASWASSTIAGTSVADPRGTGSADGTNGAAQFYQPQGIAVDSSGNLFVADSYNGTIRKIAPVGTNWVVTTLAGMATTNGYADGTNHGALFNLPFSLVLDTNGNIYVADFGNNAIRKITPVGTNWVVTTIAGLGTASGSADGTNNKARFLMPQGIAIDAAGSLYVTDGGNNTIRKVKPVGTNWVVTTLAGTAGVSGGANGTGPSAQFYSPQGIAVDKSLNLFVADSYNYTVRRGTIAPWMQIALGPNQVVVSWPAALTGYVAQACTNLKLGPWHPNTNGVVVSGDYMVQTNALLHGTAFFRLFQP